jgi:putative lipoprotein
MMTKEVLHFWEKREKRVAVVVAPYFVALATCFVAAPCSATDTDPWFGQDKALHFSATFMLAGDGYASAAAAKCREGVRLGVGASVALAAGVSKEVYDRYSGGDASMRDLTWDVVGAATGSIVSWLIDRYLF